MSAVSTFNHRDLLGLDGLTAEEINHLLDAADSCVPIVERSAPPRDTLAGRIVACLFFEGSTRTRTSFTIAAKRLGADVVDLAGSSSSRSKGETLIDTARNIEAMGVDAMVIRTEAAGGPHTVAKHVQTPVINAGDGRHEHPTQGLLDLLTLRQRFGDLAGRTIGIVGDIANSRVARSALHGLTTLGANVRLIGPPQLVPDTFKQITDGPGEVDITHDLDAAIPELDAIMMLRVQFERAAGDAIASIEDYRERYGLTAERASHLPAHAIVMHPGPINRGLELDPDVADDPNRSAVMRQVTNGVAVRMAVLGEVVEGVRG